MEVKIYEFKEHDVTISGEASHLLELADFILSHSIGGTLGDLAYKIEDELGDNPREE